MKDDKDGGMPDDDALGGMGMDGFEDEF